MFDKIILTNDVFWDFLFLRISIIFYFDFIDWLIDVIISTMIENHATSPIADKRFNYFYLLFLLTKWNKQNSAKLKLKKWSKKL